MSKRSRQKRDTAATRDAARDSATPPVVTDAGSASDVGGTASIPSGSTGDRDLSGRGYSDADLLADVSGAGAGMADLIDSDTMVGPGSGVAGTGASPVSAGNSNVRGAGVTGHGMGPSVDVVDLGQGDATIDTTADPRSSPEGIRAPEDDPDARPDDPRRG
jgi:hypothetical protein